MAQTGEEISQKQLISGNPAKFKLQIDMCSIGAIRSNKYYESLKLLRKFNVHLMKMKVQINIEKVQYSLDEHFLLMKWNLVESLFETRIPGVLKFGMNIQFISVTSEAIFNTNLV